jgi:CRP-like cAMP-binding protein
LSGQTDPCDPSDIQLDLLGLLRSLVDRRQGIAAERVYAPQQVIIREGDCDRRVFAVLSGQVRVLERVVLDDHRHIQPGLCDLMPGEIFGELTLFEPAPRSATVIALCESVLLEIDSAALAAALDDDPRLGYRLLKPLFQIQAARLRKADQRFGSLLAWGLKAHAIDRHL